MIFDKHIVHFRDLCNALDVVSSTLHREGVGIQKKHAAVISDHKQKFGTKAYLVIHHQGFLKEQCFSM